jgi:plasmid replication initiation protein
MNFGTANEHARRARFKAGCANLFPRGINFEIRKPSENMDCVAFVFQSFVRVVRP